VKVSRKIIIATVGVIVLLLAGAWGFEFWRRKQPTRSAETAVTVDAKEMVARYKTNVIAADEAYKGKFLKFSARVRSIEKQGMGAVVWASSHSLLPITDFECLFPSNRMEQVAKLEPGQTVTFTCQCSGIDYYIKMFDCQVAN
jgi:hypothetical protein